MLWAPVAAPAGEAGRSGGAVTTAGGGQVGFRDLGAEDAGAPVAGVPRGARGRRRRARRCTHAAAACLLRGLQSRGTEEGRGVWRAERMTGGAQLLVEKMEVQFTHFVGVEAHIWVSKI